MILDILQDPDPRLREKSLPVDAVDDEILSLAWNMIETMRASKGLGLAAPQVGVLKRIIVMDHFWDTPRAFINPVVVATLEDMTEGAEGCLSVFGQFTMQRHAGVVVEARTLDWEPISIPASGLMGVCFQHEIDHLDGILITDKGILSED